MTHDSIEFRDLDRSNVAIVGGKGANLGELSRLPGVRVPAGFCITTKPFVRLLAQTPPIRELLERLSAHTTWDHELGAALRYAIETTPFPADLEAAITQHLARLGPDRAYAVRSSATAEDLPSASFAGQHDSYLNVAGTKAIAQHVTRCWASLFTDRAITYRVRNGFDHRKVRMAVVVQQMVDADAAGVVFTADPVTGNRTVVSIDAVRGLGEGAVAGLVHAHHYDVRDDAVVSAENVTRTLTDEQCLELARLARVIELHFGDPQDIEWCLATDAFYIVQSRPITTLYPVPDVGDQARHVYLSVGHQQMMTNAMKPLGLSLFQLTAFGRMVEAGGRLFVDTAAALASAPGRANLLRAMSQHDPLTHAAMATLIERDFIPLAPAADPPPHPRAPFHDDPSQAAELIARSHASIETLRREIQSRSGVELLAFIRLDVAELKAILFEPRSMAMIMAALDAWTWVDDKMKEWLGEPTAAGTLSLAAPNNVTAEMGLALLDVADVIRPYPEVVAKLRAATDATFLDGLDGLEGGLETRAALEAYLERYGMRGPGEIDITTTRWSENPAALIPVLLGAVESFESGARTRKLEEGRTRARTLEHPLLERLRQLPDGNTKAAEAQRMITRLRAFLGFREYPKYGIVSRYAVYKRALLREAERLVRAGLIHERDDVYYFRFEELEDVVRTGELDERLVAERKAQHARNEKLTPPRVITSEGEVVRGYYTRTNVPAGALVGLPVSAGIVEGRARVLLTMADAVVEEGDILVTLFTDPSWTPLFVTVKGLVTEVGGLMTHGAVIAREYGLPAVVGVEHATTRIRDGQQIRLDATAGFVELL